MEKLNLGADVFTLRDYLGYLFPGVVSFYALYILDPSLLVKVEANTLIGAVVVLLGGYVAGFVCNTVGWFLMTKVLGRIIGDPLGSLLRRKNWPWTSMPDVVFQKQLMECLERYWGKALVINGNSVNLLFLCWRIIQEQPNQACAYLIRLISLYNMAAGLVIADIFVIVASFYKGHIAVGIASSIILLFLVRAFYRYRIAFGKNVFRIFFVRYRVNGKAELAAEKTS